MSVTASHFNFKSIQAKLFTIPLIFVLSLSVLTYFISEKVKDSQYQDRIFLLESVTGLAIDQADYIQAQYKKGVITKDERLAKFREVVHQLRYNGNDYFFAYEMDGTNVIHATQPDIEGKNLWDMQDPNGVYLVRSMINLAKENPSGATLEYAWPRPGSGSDEPAEKVSYVEYLPDYDIVLGTGVYVDDLKAQHAAFLNILIVLSLTIAAISVGASLYLGRSIRHPINALSSKMSQLAQGDYNIDVTEAEREDEIGSMAKTVEVFRENAERVHNLQAEQRALEEKATREKSEALLQLAADLERSVGTIAKELDSSAANLSQSARNMSDIALETKDQTHVASNAAEESTSNSQSVASAAEEMSCSVSEIATQVERSAQISQDASDRAEETSTTVLALSEEASKIGEVINLISDIAEQTNLLALNATIEAARAGDAGKGFAVVASEVKNLAQQTAKATENISDQISKMQSVTQEAVDAISLIRETVHEINKSTALISSSIEQQSAATSEIARNTTEAASENARVSQTITAISEASERNGQTAEQVAETTQSLSQQTQKLLAEVENFTSSIKKQVA